MGERAPTSLPGSPDTMVSAAYISAVVPSPDLEQQVVVDERAAGEWIVSLPGGGRSLHVYLLQPSDWLVSEVGRGNEGRGASLDEALAALYAGRVPATHWRPVVTALGSRRPT